MVRPNLRFDRATDIAAWVVILSILIGASDTVFAKKQSHGSETKPPAVETYAARPEVEAFAQEVAGQGLDATFVIATLHQARKIEAIRDAVRPAPDGVRKNWQAYRARFVEPGHIQAGLHFWLEHKAELANATKQYGVPESVIIGILGVETEYGQNIGKYRVVDALATLAFDYPADGKDREAYFRTQLAAFFHWCVESHCTPLEVYGSSSGALGMPQFMPENIDKYAVDFDGDGRVDLQSPADAIGSVARFLSMHGWTPYLSPTFSADLSGAQLEALVAPDVVPTFSYWQLQARGAKLLERLPPWEKFALVELQNGNDPSSYFIGSQNFFVLTLYNASAYYAKAVLDLGSEVKNAYRALQPDTTSARERK
jgi:peptidoglycan lytic transglycosylase B